MDVECKSFEYELESVGSMLVSNVQPFCLSLGE